MICVKCGREAKETFCDDCFLHQNELFSVEDFSIILCGICSAYYDNKWHDTKDFEEVINECVRKKIKSKNKITSVKTRFKTIGNKVHVIIACKGKIKPAKKEKTEEKKILIILKKRQCETCEKRSGGYYEALLQIRGEKTDYLIKKVQRLIEEKKPTITRIDKLQNGYDVRFMYKKEAERVIGMLRKKHTVEDSFKLVGNKDGRELYRNFFVVR